MRKLGFDLILLGDSTAGKDTQAGILKKRYNVRLAASGAYLRKFQVKKYIQGAPAPSSVIISFLNDSLKRIGNKNLIFVGAARLKNEAEYLVKKLNQAKRDFFVIYLKLPNQLVIQRSLKRAARPEDTDLHLIHQRLSYYKQEVSKTTRFYRSLRKFKFVDASQSIPQVTKEIEKIIKAYAHIPHPQPLSQKGEGSHKRKKAKA